MPITSGPTFRAPQASETALHLKRRRELIYRQMSERHEENRRRCKGLPEGARTGAALLRTQELALKPAPTAEDVLRQEESTLMRVRRAEPLPLAVFGDVQGGGGHKEDLPFNHVFNSVSVTCLSVKR